MKYQIYLGGYTAQENKGIASIFLDTDKKSLEQYQVEAELDKPTYLLAKKGVIYTCMQQGREGGMAKIVDGEVTATCNLGEGSPCHISYDAVNDCFYLANYHAGALSVVQEKEGKLEETERIYHSGSSVHPNQDKSHIHFAQVTPCGKYVLVCDLGTDEIYTYEIHRGDTVTLTEASRHKTPLGFGPRHLTYHPSKPIIYVLGELSNEVLVLSVNTDNGEFTRMQKIPTIPADFTEFSAGAAIRITEDGRFLYVSNRGYNSIAVYQVLASGELKLVEITPSAGDFPRDFDLSPEEDFLVVAHQKSGNLSLLERDRKSGKLSLLLQDIPAPECVCVHFVKE